MSRLVGSDLRAWHRFWTDDRQLGDWESVCDKFWFAELDRVDGRIEDWVFEHGTVNS
jgi:hypothetical protein